MDLKHTALMKLVPVKKRVKWRYDGSFMVAMSEETFQLVLLNSTASAIYTLIDGKRNLMDIAKRVCEAYRGIRKDRIIRDVVRNVRELESKSLVGFTSRAER